MTGAGSTMKQFLVRPKFAAFALAVMASPLLAEPAMAPSLAALSSLETGAWQVRSTSGGTTRNICISNVQALMQVHHATSACTRFVINNDPKTATISYSCPGAGHGRTTLRVETPRLVQIESQGMANNAPFDARYEARRVANCAAENRASLLTPNLPNRPRNAPVLSFK
jgi:invasion protein IalB